MKLKLNILDWVIIGILALSVLFVGYRTIFAGQPIFQAQNTITLYYQMEFRRMTPYFRNQVSVGETVHISARERDVATIYEVIAQPAQAIMLNAQTGEYIVRIIPRHYDVIVTLRSEVIETAREFRNGGTAIRVGAECVMRGRGFAAEGFILNLWREGEDPRLIENEEYDEYYSYNGDYYGYERYAEGGDE